MTRRKIAQELNISLEEVDNEAIRKYISIYGISSDYLDMSSRSIARPKPESKVIRSYGKPCGVEWDQHAPYNLYYEKNWVPSFGEGSMCEWTNHPAGCAVVAIAQILAALEPSNMKCCDENIDWSYLKENKSISAGDYFTPSDPIAKQNMVAGLFRDIYNKTKSYPQWGKGQSDNWPPEEVDCVLQTGTNSANIYEYFKSLSGVTTINYNLSGLIKWDPEIIRQSLQYSFPVFVGGNGHAFVLDEFLCCSKVLTTYTLIQQYDVYFHANFGWGENNAANGYYLVEDTQNGNITFETSEADYKDSELNILPFIGKKTI